MCGLHMCFAYAFHVQFFVQVVVAASCMHAVCIVLCCMQYIATHILHYIHFFKGNIFLRGSGFLLLLLLFSLPNRHVLTNLNTKILTILQGLLFSVAVDSKTSQCNFINMNPNCM